MTELSNSARNRAATPVPSTFEDWLAYGYRQGWCGPPVCDIHDALPTSEAEDQEWDENGEICVHIIRLYADAEEKAGVEANHAPSVWRASNRGL